MKRLFYSSIGHVEDVLKLEDAPIPELKETDVHSVLVKVHFVSVNPGDCHMIEPGVIKVKPYPNVPCLDFAGVVEKVGANCSRVQPGQRIMGSLDLKHGAAAQYLICLETQVVALADDVPFERAAGVPTTAAAAYQSLLVRKPKPEHRVLVLGGSSGCGTATIQLLKNHFQVTKIVATCGNQNKDKVQSLGVDQVIDYKNQKWEQELSGQAFDLIVDAVGDDNAYSRSLAVLHRGGAFVSITGEGMGPGKHISMLGLMWRILVNKFRSWMPWNPAFSSPVTSVDVKGLDQYGQMLNNHELNPLIDQVFELNDYVAAFQRLRSGHAAGKVIIRME